MKKIPTPPIAEECRRAMVEAMKPYADALGVQGMLAVASALVGQLVAMQDQCTMTREMALRIVSKNIEQGNLETVEALMSQTAGNA